MTMRPNTHALTLRAAPIVVLPASQSDALADSLLDRSRENQADQDALAEAAPYSLAFRYSTAFTVQLEAKQDQGQQRGGQSLGLNPSSST